MFVGVALCHSFRSSFIVEVVTEINLSSCENSGIDIKSNSEFSDFAYAGNVLLLSKVPAVFRPPEGAFNCVLHFRCVKCCSKTELVRNRTFL